MSAPLRRALGGANLFEGPRPERAGPLELVDASPPSLADSLAAAEASGAPSLIGSDAAVTALLRDWPVRDQGDHRETCVPFATLAALELRARLAPGATGFPDFSEEFLYAKMRAGPPPDPKPRNYDAGATFLDQAALALQTSGVCPEAALPYDPLILESAHVAEVTPEAEAEAAAFRLTPPAFAYDRFDPANPDPWRDKPVLEEIVAQLARRNPVAITLPLYDGAAGSGWLAGPGWDKGVVPDPAVPHVTDPTAKDRIFGGHAVCLVGYLPGADAPAEGRFTFRNSWGTGFGVNFGKVFSDGLKPPAPGYGTISAAHVANHCWEILYRVEPPSA